LWNFIWQGAMPPGFSHLDVREGTDADIEQDGEDSGPALLFCFSASQSDILHELAEQSQIYLKNIADVHEMILGTPVDNSHHHLIKKKIAAGALIGNRYPEYAGSSYLLSLRLNQLPPGDCKFSAEEKETYNELLAGDFHSLTENKPGLLHHLYTSQMEQESGHYLLSYCDRVKPFQDILDRLTTPAFLQANWNGLKMSSSLFFVPSLEILAGLRMGTLRMGPLSPTARWK